MVFQLFRRGTEEIQPLDNPFLDPIGHCGVMNVFVIHREIVKNVLTLLVHAGKAVLNDHGHFVCKCRVIRENIRNHGGEHLAVSIFVLKPFTI